MLTFPSLRSGAVLQYPASRATRFATEVLSFLDGSEQRYRLASAPIRKWLVQLDMLDEAELNTLESFVTDTEGAFATFAFTDPRDGLTYPKCYMESDVLQNMYVGGLRGNTSLVICQLRTP